MRRFFGYSAWWAIGIRFLLYNATAIYMQISNVYSEAAGLQFHLYQLSMMHKIQDEKWAFH